MESPTSSDSPPTESNSAETVTETKPIEFKEEDGLKVDKRSSQKFLMAGDYENPTALKCPSCAMLTAHLVTSIIMYDATKSPLEPDKERISKRIVGCTNCGYIRTK